MTSAKNVRFRSKSKMQAFTGNCPRVSDDVDIRLAMPYSCQHDCQWVRMPASC